MDILTRFDAIMAHALHVADTPEGRGTPWTVVERDVVGLVEQERREAPCAGLSEHDMNVCRFAVYAWVDEKLLGSRRPDAVQWASCSLQQRYFGTTAAGTEFYSRLREQLDAFREFHDPLEPSLLACPDNDLPSLLLRFGCGRPDMPAPAASLRLKEAAVPPAPEVLQVYALCLVYGFRGKLFRLEHEALLRELREAGYRLLQPGLPAPQPPVLVGRPGGAGAKPTEREGWRGALRLVEPYFLMLAPLAVCAALYVYCAGVLASLSLPSGQ